MEWAALNLFVTGSNAVVNIISERLSARVDYTNSSQPYETAHGIIGLYLIGVIYNEQCAMLNYANRI